jgi:hypothetical protein
MKSLSELADTYEKWATANEACADEILAAQDSYADEGREYQPWPPEQLRAEAAALKKRAVEIRNLEERRSMYCVDSQPPPVRR